MTFVVIKNGKVIKKSTSIWPCKRVAQYKGGEIAVFNRFTRKYDTDINGYYRREEVEINKVSGA